VPSTLHAYLLYQETRMYMLLLGRLLVTVKMKELLKGYPGVVSLNENTTLHTA